ncbi:hypothetical protein HF521_013217 [Silurus meridionalis]|uniref:Secreted protein n=1 Tax=Silurus meridionalis TaxID=175797 RepID=A0A8T0ABL8_SILME|nr:hypothetical protein HF521_013217 [Silurus meridionalis]
MAMQEWSVLIIITSRMIQAGCNLNSGSTGQLSGANWTLLWAGLRLDTPVGGSQIGHSCGRVSDWTLLWAGLRLDTPVGGSLFRV